MNTPTHTTTKGSDSSSTHCTLTNFNNTTHNHATKYNNKTQKRQTEADQTHLQLF